MTQELKLTVRPNANPLPGHERDQLLVNAGFGQSFTDHMVTIRWNEAEGWHDAQLRAREPFLIDPACSVLHYAQEVFEGMKAYRTTDGAIALFRPLENARRLQRSARRIAMPELPEAYFLEAVEALVRIDKDWIPDGEGSLYLRPFMFASDAFLGVRPGKEYIFCVIASPAGAYFKGGVKPISVWVPDDFSRAARGGTGAAKTGGNYAASLLPQSEAMKNGCDQVVFLDSAEHRWVDELGGMNIFFVLDDGTLMTPPLGTILEGITRDSIATLARDLGMHVEERAYSFDEWKADAASGRLREVFACGTAAVLVGIGHVRFPGGEFSISNGVTGPVTEQLRELLVGLQRGKTPDAHQWLHRLG